MSEKLRILIVEDSENDALLLVRHLRQGGYEVAFQRVDDALTFEAALDAGGWDLVVADYNIPGFGGLAALRLFQQRNSDLPFIVVSGTIGESKAVEMMKAGAHDYLMKDNLARLIPAVERELREAETRRERRRAEQELQRSQQNWATIFQAIGHQVLLLSPDHKILAANQAAIKAIGLSEREMIGQDCRELLHYTYQGGLPEGCPLEAVCTTGRMETVEMEMKALEGYFLVSCTPMLDADGKVEKIIHIATDITARRQAELSLSENENYLDKIINTVADPLLVKDRQHRWVLLNDAFCQFFGYPREVLLGKSDYDFFPKSEADVFWRNDELVLASGVENINEEKVTDARGVTHTIITKKSRYVNETGEPFIVGIIRDVTEIKAIADHLALAKSQLENIIEFLPDATFIVDQDKRLIAWNRAMEEMTGIPKEQMLGKEHLHAATPFYGTPRKFLMDLIGLDDDDLAQRYDYVKKRGDAIFAEVFTPALHRGRGGYVWAIASPLFDQNGKVVGAIESIREITERIKAETALQESEETFRALAENSQDTIMRFDRQLRHLYANPAVERETGIPPEKFIGKTHEELGFPPELCRLWGEAITRVFDRAQPVRVEFQLPAGGWIDWILMPEFAADGSVKAVITSARDITELKKTEQALHESESRYRLIATNVGDVIWTTDLDLHFTYISPSIQRMRGFTVEEMKARTLRDILPPKSLERALALFSEAMGADGEWSSDLSRTATLEWEEYRKDGSLIWTENEVSFLRDDQQKVVGIVGISRDCSRRKQDEEERNKLENQLRQSQKMEAIGRLAGGVAHDFNNILTGIIGYSDILLHSLSPHDPSSQDLLEIKKAAERASRLTGQLLAFSRKQIIDPKVIDLNVLLADSSAMLQRLVGEDVELLFKPAERIGRIKVDPGQIEQVLVNLVVNARDAMPDGGKLIVQTDNVIIDQGYLQQNPEAIPGDYVQVSVSDTGCGMDGSVLKHLFEPFFTTKAKGKGTGLGLSTVYGIVKQNKGFINVYSEVDLGTTFKVYFPLVEEEPETITAAKTSALPLGNEMILLVEDEEMVRNLAKKILERHGYKVFSADSGGDAYLFGKEHPRRIDLLLTDVVLPDINGRALFEQLAPLRPGLKVIFMSGYTDDVIAYRGVLQKGQHFIQKPFTIETLVRKVREVLDLPA
ncbi:MAG: PAS domain S-box protein [Myxococcales bacterium]|nr:PAS domain S-box protein [Myxococcales bacterium]